MTTKTPWTHYLFWAAALAGLAALAYYFSNIVGCILSAWILSLIGQPLADLFQKIRIGRFRIGPSAAALLTLFVFILIAGLTLLLFVPMILTQAGNMAHVDYTAIAEALEQPFSRLYAWLQKNKVIMPEGAPEQLLQKALEGWFEPSRLGSAAGYAIMTIGNTLINFFSTLFIAFFFLKEKNLFANFILTLTPEAYQEPMRETIHDTITMLSRYFLGILIQITLITVYVSLALTIVGIKNAVLIGFFAAIMNVIPYLGPFFGGAVGIFLAFTTNLELDFYSEMLPLLAKVLAVFITSQWLDNYILSPTIFSKSVLAHPLEIFLIVLMGAKIAGFTGMIMAIPAYTVVRVFAKEFLQQFRIVQKMTERMKQSGI